jgi:uncharacterized protein YndB with AHSA1/START domain
MMNDRIEKTIELKAPISKVWKALTDYREFSEWFQVKLEGPFIPGKMTSGKLTYPGYENHLVKFFVLKMDPEHFFSYNWHPYSFDTKRDYSKEIPTLVEFKLEKIDKGTRLKVVESGFDKIPDDRRLEAFRMNSNGWKEQIENIEKYVSH